MSTGVVPLPSPAATPGVNAGELAVGGLPLWSWLVAAALAIGAALVWSRRRRSDEEGEGELAFAGAAPVADQPRERVPASSPAPPPLRPAAEAAPVSRPQPDGPGTPAPPIGIVSTRLRPWIDLEFAPLRLTLTEGEALVEFELHAVNNGGMPARELAIEAVILNAGAEQEAEIATFFARTDIPGGGIEAVPPLGRVPLRSQARLPRELIREYAVENRRVFVPIVAFNAAYRWSGGEGRTSASFLVGRGAADAQKLAPFRVDQGSREWRDLAARLLPTAVRR